MGGRWILKFGSETYPKLPENEFVTMAWAAASGLKVPRHRLIAARDIEGLDDRFRALGEYVFAIERYDRGDNGSRVHQEDFATDAHLKNWSLIYPDGRTARLSPAYDFVCVRQYLPQDLALPLAKEKVLDRVSWDHVARVEKFLRTHGHVTDFERTGRDFVQRCLDEWTTLRHLAQPEHRKAIDEHIARSPLVRGLGAP